MLVFVYPVIASVLTCVERLRCMLARTTPHIVAKQTDSAVDESFNQTPAITRSAAPRFCSPHAAETPRQFHFEETSRSYCQSGSVSTITCPKEIPSLECPKISRRLVRVRGPSPVAFAGPGSYAAVEKRHALIAYLVAFAANLKIL